MSISASELRTFPIAGKGNYFEDFVPGLCFEHQRGRTLSSADNTLFNTLTIQLNPLYLDAVAACERGHPQVPLQPWMIFTTVFGLTVEDLSEKGGAFLGIDDLKFHKPLYPGATLRARSTVHACRRSDKNPAFGIVTWFTEGFEPDGTCVISFTRTNMVVARSGVKSGDSE